MRRITTESGSNVWGREVGEKDWFAISMDKVGGCMQFEGKLRGQEMEEGNRRRITGPGLKNPWDDVKNAGLL
jgi:hypothetical protein